MKIRHVQTLFSPEHGGPTHSLSNYCRAQIEDGHEVSLVVAEGHHGTSPAVRLPPPVKQLVLPLAAPTKLGRCPAMKSSMRSMSKPEIYHVHGSWHLALSAAVAEAKAQKVPVILELMGSFSAYELSRKPLRKILARRLYQDRTIASVDCVHANSVSEAAFMRSLGFKVPIAVIPVGVSIATAVEQGQDWRSELIPADWGQRKWILFLARLHHTKGVDLLLEAWSRSMRGNDEWRLLIAGHGDPEYVAMLKARVEEMGIVGECHFSGPISEEQKIWAYAHATAYVLPSRQENFGNTVAEALAQSRPVGTTTGTPWAILESQQCGWVEEPTLAGISNLLKRIAETPKSELDLMGRRGRSLVEARFSLPAVQASLLRVYQWLLGGPSPDDILYTGQQPVAKSVK